MKKLRWQLLIIFMTGLVVGILLLAEQPEAGQVAAPQPAQGGIYAEALVGSLQRLNPLLDLYNPVDRDINRLIFSGLLRFDARGMPQSDLAESWGVSRDGTVYNFSLRSGVKWHDGEPLTADDVIFTLQLIREAEGLIPDDVRQFWQQVEVTALSPTALRFELPAPYAPFLDYLTFGVLPEHLLGGMYIEDLINAPFNLSPVGSGPYRFDRLLIEGDQIYGVVLTAFADYYGEQHFLDQVVFRYYYDAPAALAAYQEGEVQGIGRVTADILPGVLTEPELSLYTGRNPQLSLVLFNLKNPEVPFFEVVEIRKALMMGLNRQWMIDRILQGQAIIANGPILPGTWAYHEDLEPIPFDPEAALNTLKDAGYLIKSEDDTIRQKDDVQLHFELLHPDTELHQKLAEAIQSDWLNLGVRVDLIPMPYEILIEEYLEGRTFQAALVDLNLARSPDPDPYPFWDQAQATGGQNYTQWDNRIASENIKQARVTSDLNERQRMYRNFQVIFNEDLPALPLFYPVYNYAVDRQVRGVQMGPLFDPSDRFVTLHEWFMITGQPLSATPTPTQTIPEE